MEQMGTEKNAGGGTAGALGARRPRSEIRCSQFENIWLRTKRKNADGKVVGGSGGVCYLYFPVHMTAVQRRALASSGVS